MTDNKPVPVNKAYQELVCKFCGEYPVNPYIPFKELAFIFHFIHSIDFCNACRATFVRRLST